MLAQQDCQFAVKSGGHASFVGASNIDSGVTIDLGNLNSIKSRRTKQILLLRQVPGGVKFTTLFLLQVQQLSEGEMRKLGLVA